VAADWHARTFSKLFSGNPGKPTKAFSMYALATTSVASIYKTKHFSFRMARMDQLVLKICVNCSLAEWLKK